MPSLLKAASSQVGRKFLTGLTGIFLFIFVVFHLSGNLAIFGDVDAMNRYSMFLHDLGPLLWIARIGLLAVFLIHTYIGISIWILKRRARPQKYEVYSSKGGPSRQSLSSRSMAFTGVVLLIFVVIHIDTFALGDTGTVMIDGQQTHDIKSLVIETFQGPYYAFGYTFVMLLLGVHLGHGIWSSFTSLTVKSKKASAIIYSIGIIFAILMAVGFLFIPMYIYFGGGCEASLIQCR
ncbi:succinate dehydrogenase cytochrome b subunit [Rhodohalobacter sp. 8-1]|uniref:succinate dehydrogenase cytochrome b subunit n=1 Tax=Rhodohalobacter sp. 8-1 TaxID=3131972 RepID=UPI0030ED50C2